MNVDIRANIPIGDNCSKFFDFVFKFELIMLIMHSLYALHIPANISQDTSHNKNGDSKHNNSDQKKQ